MKLGKLFGDQELERAEDFINGILSTPVEAENTVQDTSTSDFLNGFFSKDDPDQVEQLLNRFTIPAERILRYQAYDEIYRSVPMVKRIVKVYKPYVLQKNPVTGNWYLLRDKEVPDLNQRVEFEKEAKVAKSFIIDVIKKYKLLYKLKNQILHNQLIYGDVYVEVVDLHKEIPKVDISKISTVLTEAQQAERLEKQVNSLSRTVHSTLSPLQVESLVEALADVMIKVDDDPPSKEESQGDDSLLRIHLPHNIIPLQTKYGTQLGYLEVDRQDTETNVSNIGQTLSTITNKIANLSTTNDTNLVQSREEIIEKIIVYALRKVTSGKFDDKTVNDLKRFILEQNIANKTIFKQIKVRFIPLTDMVQFSMESSDNYPFGTSIIDQLLLPGKLFILSQLANIMTKLSRSPVSRKWVIDQGLL